MKSCRHILIFMVLSPILVGMVSCDGDDDEKPPVSIVGKWQIESRELFDCADPADNNTVQCTSTSTSSDCGTWEFKSDGNYAVAEVGGGGYTYQYEAHASGQLDLCYNNTCYPHQYSIIGSQLVITEGDFSTSCLHKWTLVKI